MQAVTGHQACAPICKADMIMAPSAYISLAEPLEAAGAGKAEVRMPHMLQRLGERGWREFCNDKATKNVTIWHSDQLVAGACACALAPAHLRSQSCMISASLFCSSLVALRNQQ